MKATAVPTDSQADPRDVPGGGKENPVHHTVRIVVVGPPAGSTPAVDRHGPGQSHDLTEDELKKGEQALQELDAAGLPITTSGKHVTMFDVLKPTDIVVMRFEPTSLRVLNKDGKPVAPHTADTPNSAALPGEPPTKHLHAHDDCHRDTVLRVWTESDTVEYQCDEEFEIERMERAGWKLFGAPDNPFERERGATPYKATKEPTSTIDADGNPKFVWKWTSGVVPASANNQQYKATFKIRGKSIDPDVVCGDPPPAP
jgi:hypothetical protein